MIKLAVVIENVIQLGNPILRAKNKKVDNVNDEKVIETVQNLIDSMRHYNLIGMAAPQIGVNLKIFVTEIRPTPSRKPDVLDNLRIFINPKIIFKSKKEVVMYEGCGSVANGDLFGPVKRAEKIIVKTINEKGKSVKLKADGLLARVIQHEYDHLVGIEFVEKITDSREIMSKSEYIKMMEKSK